MMKLIADAMTTRIRLETIGALSTAQAAARLVCCRPTLTDWITPTCPARDIADAILDGRQPRTVTRRRLATIGLPIDWQLQRRMLGFG